MNKLLTAQEISNLIFSKVDAKLQEIALALLVKYADDLNGYFVGPNGCVNQKFYDENWHNMCSVAHRLLQGPERHGDADGSALDYYLSDRYFSKCSDWLREMSPAVLREIERQLWH
jgi:hypothetical protein